MSKNRLWYTKLLARLHDPAEKALVLMRDPAGHEGGTVRSLVALLQDTPEAKEFAADPAIQRWVQWADWWAAAADRPQWPQQERSVTTKEGVQKTLAVAPWARVVWSQRPILIHPLTGDQIDLRSLGDVDIGDLKERSFRHFSRLWQELPTEEGRPDLRQALLHFWRFGPELEEEQDNGQLGALWPLLPADTRVPDHSIWDHLDLTSAFAGAFAADPEGEAALLALSIGPVQDFIAAARTTSDLWAGSHLLSRLAWEAMRPVCEALGPDAILFPRLRGIPQVDLWLRDEMGLPAQRFANCAWNRGGTDANPLFSAALPNRFVAVVPASQARPLAERITQGLRAWMQDLGEEVVSRLLHAGGYDVETEREPYEQMRRQLEGFPEVHWSTVPFSLIRCRNQERQTDLDTVALSEAMAPFFGARPGEPCGFLSEPVWLALSRDIAWEDGSTFWAPNPGVLYPAVYDLAERVLAAAKSLRPFAPLNSEGWRCSLTGEAEWLTTDRERLSRSFRRQTDTLWARVARAKPSWAKAGEHLSGLPAIKRLWPTIYREVVGQALSDRDDGSIRPIDRFVVSTHTMALAHQLERWLERGAHTSAGFRELDAHAERVALPRRLLQRHRSLGTQALEDAKRLPGLLEWAEEQDDPAEQQKARRAVRETLACASEQEDTRLETYYGLLMMDGDRMGAMLSGDASTGTAIAYRQSFHPDLLPGFDEHAKRQAAIARYGAQKRAISPNRHLAISGALNDFSQTIVRHVIESEHLGQVIYAGGDDVLAMLPVPDLLPAMERLRAAYSGASEEDVTTDWQALRRSGGLHGRNGFVWLNGRLLRTMGRFATASAGAVIAHHQAPLPAVLRALRAAEKRAKTEGGRNAFSLVVVKRSGGTLQLTAAFGEPLRLLHDLRGFLAGTHTSRRAVYHSLDWLKDLPPIQEAPDLLESLLAYQLSRQSGGDPVAPSLAKRLRLLAQEQKDGRSWLENFLSVAEFLAREIRSAGDEE
ncbi:type III-B CRISPR-associated protein Cas10/Cmr2 [Acidithiobacillus caldus]